MAPKSILSLPMEVIDVIISQVGSFSPLHGRLLKSLIPSLQIDTGLDKVSFSRTCRIFRERVPKKFVNHIDVEFQEAAIAMGSPIDEYQSLTLPLTSRIRGKDVARYTHEIKGTPSRRCQIAPCETLSCRACTLAGSLDELDQLLSSKSLKLSQQDRSLTLRGKFGKRSTFGSNEPGGIDHDFVGRRGLAAMHPESFEFNMYWKYWDINILHVLSLPHLVNLKVPLGLASDTLNLGKALVLMSSLKSLTVTEIPDDQRFIRLLPFLGLGILSRSATLRELDLSLTNFNRPDLYCQTWERHSIEDEAFVGPEDFDYFFRAIFPESPDEVSDAWRHEYTSFRDTIRTSSPLETDNHGLLRLQKLRLKHINLLLQSFTEIFDLTTLEEFHPQYCNIDREIWTSLKSSRLMAIENVDYELLPDIFKLLASKPSLECLSFARPLDVYQEARIIHWPGDEAHTLLMQKVRQPPPLSQGTEWGQRSCYFQQSEVDFPSSDELLDALSRTRIEYLLLPADLYDITSRIFGRLGTQLPFLRQLTLGFDYSEKVSLFPERLTAGSK